MSDRDEQITVRCMAMGCKRDYPTTRVAWERRGCVCPACGESKAQLRDDDA